MAVAPGPNLEARARAARFAVLPAGVATGHTMDDQAETVLLNVLRGAGGRRPGRHGARDRATRCSACAGPRPTRCAGPPASSRCATRATRTPPSPATGSATSSCRCAPTWPGATRCRCWPARPALLRDEVALLEALAAAALPDPADARAVAAADPVPGPPRPAGLAARRGRPGGTRPRWPRWSGPWPWPGARRSGPSWPAATGCAAAAGRLRVERADSASAGISVTPVTQEEAGAGVPSWAEPDVGPVLVDAGRLATRVAELGAQITADYADEPPLLVAVLKGAMLFMSDLCRAIALPVDVDFMAVSSYGSATKTSGVVRIVKDLDAELEGRHVLVVEDIIDSGLTLNYLRRYLHARAAQERRGLRAAGQGGRAAGRARPQVRRLHHPARLRRGLRPRRGRALPQPVRCPPLQGRRPVSVDIERVEGRRGRAAQRHRRGPRPRRAGRTRRAGWPPCTRSCSRACTTTRPATSR